MQAIILAFAAMVCGEVSTSQPASQPAEINPSQVSMIFWEKQSWKAGGAHARLTLWADGRSEIRVSIPGGPANPNPGWTAEVQGVTVYVKKSPYSKDETIRKFHAAIDAGIEKLKTFPPGYDDGAGTLCGVEIDGKLKQTVIPMFLLAGEKDNKGSENERIFKAVDAVLGDFDANPLSKNKS